MIDTGKISRDWESEYNRCNEKLKNMMHENECLNCINKELTEKLKRYESVLMAIKVLGGVINE